MDFEELDAKQLTDEHIARFNTYGNKMRAESRPEDPPQPLEADMAFLRNIPDFVEAKGYVLAGGDGEWIAAAQGVVFNTGENMHALQVELSVLAPHRRRGIGRELLRHIIALADRWERTLLIGNTNERIPAGAEFAMRLGANPGLNAHTNRLVLADVDTEMVTRWIEEGPVRAPDYSLMGFDGECPDDLVDDVADVLNVMNDAPRDDLQLEDTKMTGERFRAQERLFTADGTESWWLFAKHDEGGGLVGLTDVHWNANNPDTVFQGNTAVRPEHRGHALGKWLKASMLQRILNERSQAKDIRTGNADSNDAMLGINHQLGFKPFIANTTWQLSIEKAKTYLTSAS